MAQAEGKRSTIIERDDVNGSLLGDHFKQPENSSSSGNNVTKTNDIGVLYDCPHCDKVFDDKRNLEAHILKHQQIVYCCICNRNQLMQIKDFHIHLTNHENDILNTSGISRVTSSNILDVFEKRYEEDSWVQNPFDDQELTDILKLLKISTAKKNFAIVYIKVKAWFINLSYDEEESQPRSVWLSLPPIQLSIYDMNVESKLKELGNHFLSKLSDQADVDGGGSGFVYLAISDMTVTVVKNLQFGCRYCELCQPCVKCSMCSNCSNICEICKKMESLESKGAIYNPKEDEFCFINCINKFLTLSDLGFEDKEKIQDSLKTLGKEISLDSVEKWAKFHPYLSLHIFMINQIEDKVQFHPILFQKGDNEKFCIKIAATLTSTKENKGHFSLILNDSKFQKGFTKSGKKGDILRHYKRCQYCFVYRINNPATLLRHEQFCRENQKSLRSDEDKMMTECFEFPEETTFLKMNKALEESANAPNWYGFLDFETVSQNIPYWKSKIAVCPEHSLQGQIECNCAKTLLSKKLRTLSYFLVIFDFHTQKQVFEKFYIRKNERDLPCGDHLVYTLKNLAYKIALVNQLYYPIEMTDLEKRRHMQATHCQSCKQKFVSGTVSGDILGQTNVKSELFKVPRRVPKHAHHLHHLKHENFISSLCGKCNLAIQSRRQNIPIYCHNLGKFDHVFMLKSLYRAWPSKIFLVQSSLNTIFGIRAWPFVFKDSLRFLSGSLEKNVDMLKESCMVYCKKCRDQLQCTSCLEETYKKQKMAFNSIHQSQLSKVNGVYDKQRFVSNLAKAAFPYSILTTYENLISMTEFPKKEFFYSHLKEKHVDEDSFQTAKKYFEAYCGSMLDFLEIYNKLDCYLLHAVWKVQSDILFNSFGMYVEQFYTLPSYSLEIAKYALYKDNDYKNTGIELFSEKNKSIYFMVTQNLRGGIVFSKSKFELSSLFKECILRSFVDNQSIVKDDKANKDLIYIDATNLYGFSLSERLPFGNYKYISQDFIDRVNRVLKIEDKFRRHDVLSYLLPDDSDTGFLLEVDILRIPNDLQEFPPFFSPQIVTPADMSPYDIKLFESLNGKTYTGKKNATLLPITQTYKSYLTHYRLFKAAVMEGAKVHVTGGVSFRQKHLFKEHISRLSKLRASSKNPAHRQAFKLASNSLFGKTMQSVIKYAKEYHLYYCNDINSPPEAMLQKLGEVNRSKKRHIIKDVRFLDDGFIAVESQLISGLKADNCPMIAFCILEIAKWRNFEFYWRMKRIAPTTRILYSDTDSFILLVKHTWYKKMESMKLDFDFSEFSKTVLESLKTFDVDMQERKGIIGTYKSEISKNDIFVGFISLQKKSYCLLLLRPEIVKENITYYKLVEAPTAKRLNTNQLKFENYINALGVHKIQTQSRWRFLQKNKSMHLSLHKYSGLSSFDESNYTKSCGIHNSFFCEKKDQSFSCQICQTEGSNISFDVLKNNLRIMQNGLFHFEKGVLIFERNSKRKEMI